MRASIGFQKSINSHRRRPATHELTTNLFLVTIGLDLGNKNTQCAVYGADRERIEERKVTTNGGQITTLQKRFVGARIVMEASIASRWIFNLAKQLGHEVIIANPRCTPITTSSVRKCDRNDARLLAELGQLRPSFLNPVTLRDDCFQELRTLLFVRQQLVKQRTALVCFIRSEVRVLGHSLPSCGAKVFARKCRALILESLQTALNPVFDAIQNMNDGANQSDESIVEISKNDFPQTKVLRQVHGVGPLIALALVATVGDPGRFSKSRTIGAYLGFVPRIKQSGKSDPALSITKCGDLYMHSLFRVSSHETPRAERRRLRSASIRRIVSLRKEVSEAKLELELPSRENSACCSTLCFVPAKSTRTKNTLYTNDLTGKPTPQTRLVQVTAHGVLGL